MRFILLTVGATALGLVLLRLLSALGALLVPYGIDRWGPWLQIAMIAAALTWALAPLFGARRVPRKRDRRGRMPR